MIDKSFHEIVKSIAAKSPTPGGGAAAALAASMGCALTLMIVRFCRGKKANAAREGELEEAETFLQRHLDLLLPTAERDCASFDLVSAAYALPKSTETEIAIRQKAIDEGMVGAMVVPEEVLHLVRDVLGKAAQIAGCVSKAIASDLGSGAELLYAGAKCAAMNVKVNANFLQDRTRATAAVTRAETVVDEIERNYLTVRGTVDGLLA
jgi:formiminotetrahydrofolate cyclodeaminase